MVMVGRTLPSLHDASDNEEKREGAHEEEGASFPVPVAKSMFSVVAPPAGSHFRDQAKKHGDGIRDLTRESDSSTASREAIPREQTSSSATVLSRRAPASHKCDETRVEIALGPIAEENVQAFLRILVGAAVGEVLSKWGLDEASDKCEDAGQLKISGPASATNTGEAEGAVT